MCFPNVKFRIVTLTYLTLKGRRRSQIPSCWTCSIRNNSLLLLHRLFDRVSVPPSYEKIVLFRSHKLRRSFSQFYSSSFTKYSMSNLVSQRLSLIRTSTTLHELKSIGSPLGHTIIEKLRRVVRGEVGAEGWRFEGLCSRVGTPEFNREEGHLVDSELPPVFVNRRLHLPILSTPLAFSTLSVLDQCLREPECYPGIRILCSILQFLRKLWPYSGSISVFLNSVW